MRLAMRIAPGLENVELLIQDFENARMVMDGEGSEKVNGDGGKV
jgi:hypothetical protein